LVLKDFVEPKKINIKSMEIFFNSCRVIFYLLFMKTMKLVETRTTQTKSEDNHLFVKRSFFS
jgi:hypothetical protein